MQKAPRAAEGTATEPHKKGAVRGETEVKARCVEIGTRSAEAAAPEVGTAASFASTVLGTVFCPSVLPERVHFVPVPTMLLN